MKVLYLLPTLPPKIPSAEALTQEIDWLSQRFNGQTVHINPNTNRTDTQRPLWPRMVFGFHMLPLLRRMVAQFDLCHFFNPDPFPFWALRWLGKPVVYSLTGGVDMHMRFNTRFFNSCAAVTALDEVSLQQLQAHGVNNAWLVRPGHDSSRFTYTPQKLGQELRLVMASAPWTLAQFGSKGVDALLTAAQLDPNLKLILVWRGVLLDELQARIRQRGLAERVQVIDGATDMNVVLSQAHAAIALAETAQIIKAYPHSLLDALAAGKPVLIGRAIPMAGYVQRTGCGVVLDEVSVGAVLGAAQRLREGYASFAKQALQCGRKDFGIDAMVDSYRRVYKRALGGDR